MEDQRDISMHQGGGLRGPCQTTHTLESPVVVRTGDRRRTYLTRFTGSCSICLSNGICART